jgi:hypothetical protein
LFEELLGVGGALLIHVGDAQRVEAIGFGAVVVRRGFLRRRGWAFGGARMKKCRGDA